MPRHADLALVERCRADAFGAFEELYRTHAPRLYGLVTRMVGRLEADDVLQDVFLTVHRKLRLYEGDAALGTWLFRVATNVCIDHLRRKDTRLGMLTDELDREPAGQGTSPGPVLGVIDRLDLERAMASLPSGARSVFVLHDVEGFGHREIAEMLGISEGTSKSQLHRARVRLRRLLAVHGGTP